MNKKRTLKIAAIVIGAGILIAGGIGYYMFNQPKRDVQGTATDFHYKSSQIVNEYLADANQANQKYLNEEGESKILEIEGEVSTISEDFNNQKVVLLKSLDDKAGVSCTFTPETGADVANIKVGDQVSIKGVIRAGASFDEDLDMYENVTMDKCKLIEN